MRQRRTRRTAPPRVLRARPPAPPMRPAARLLLGSLLALCAGLVLAAAASPAAAAEAPAFTSTPVSPGNDTTPVWEFTKPAGAQLDCHFTRPDGTTVVADCHEKRYAPTVTANGTYSLFVRATTDGVTADSPTSSYVLDTVAPSVAITGEPASPSDDRTPTWSLALEAGATGSCSLAGPGGSYKATACTTSYTADLTGAPEGEYKLTVTAKDAAGNTASTTSSPYVLDIPIAAPTVTAPASPARATTVDWSFTTEKGAKARCRLTDPNGTVVATADPCTSPWTTTLGSGDGSYTATVVLYRGSELSYPGTASYVLDTTAPAAPVVTGTSGLTNDPSVSWSFTGEAGATAACTLHRNGTAVSTAGCRSPYTPTLAPDGVWFVTVVITDAAGNVSLPGKGPEVTLDTTAPPAPQVLSAPASPSNGGSTKSFTWNFTTPEGVQCRVVSGGATVGGDWTSCADGVRTLSTVGLSDGSYVLELRSRDALGNTSAVVTSTVVLDTTAPAAPTVSAPPSPNNSRTPSWTLTTEPDARLECRLTGPNGVPSAWATCASPHVTDLSGRPDGSYLLEARATDLAGNRGPSGGARYVLDTTAPGRATVTAPVSPSSNTGPIWTLASDEVSTDPGLTANCRVLHNGAVLLDWAACAVSATGEPFALDLTGRPDGRYRLEVRLHDVAGNVGASTGADYLFDTTPPAAVSVVAPPSPDNSRTPTWRLSGEAGARLQCRFGDAAVFTACPADGDFVADLGTAPDGTYTLTVRAVDAAGNVGPQTATSYVLDTRAPAAPAVTAPASPSRDTAPVWTWTGEAGTTATCTLTHNSSIIAIGSCSTPWQPSLRGDGIYGLWVRLTDAAGNTSAAGSASYVLDTTPPPAPTVTGPSSPSSLTTPTFTFAVESEALVECRFSYGSDPNRLRPFAEGWQPCTGGTVSLTVDAEGTYRLEVRATDAAGNTSAVAAVDYVYDEDAPAGLLNLIAPPSPDNERLPRWTFTAPDGATTSCRLSGPAGVVEEGPCVGGFVPAVPLAVDGTYLLRVTVTDALGNVGINDLLYQLDTRGPGAPTVTPVDGLGRDPDVQWSWVGSASSWECRLHKDGAVVRDWYACTPGSMSLRSTGEGHYALDVVGLDALGNRGAGGLGRYTWDATPPAALGVSTTSPTSGPARQVVWTFPVPGDAVTVQCGVRRDGGFVRRLTTCSGSYLMDLSGQSFGTYYVVVRFADLAGNVTEQVRAYVLSRTASAPAPIDPSGGGAGDGSGGTGDGSGGSGGSSLGPAGPRASRGGTGADALSPGFRAPVLDRALPGGGPLAAVQDDATAPVGIGDGVVAAPGQLRQPGLALPGGRFTGSGAVEALKDVAEETIRKPQLPIALLLLVALFLLIQNRIDRRDPKLAGVPVEEEPELEFRPFHRVVVPGSVPGMGGAPA
jgi:hypothetical protein